MPTRRAPRIALFVLLLALALVPATAAASVSPAAGAGAAQETETPTPAAETVIALPSGAVYVLEHRATYGDVAVATVVGLLLIVVVVYALLRVTRQWL